MNQEQYIQDFLANVEAISSQHDIPWLAAIRIYRGITQKELALSMGLYLEEYVNIECSATPDADEFLLALECLGLPKAMCETVIEKRFAA